MKTRITIFALLLSLTFGWNTFAHDGHSDPVLAELNDYLMAIQLMRIKDSRAADIFKIWQEVKFELIV